MTHFTEQHPQPGLQPPAQPPSPPSAQAQQPLGGATPQAAEAGAPAPETLVLGGGCFWCVEAVFLQVRGVVAVESGYANGDGLRFPTPSYEAVCTGETGYNEVVKLVFQPDVLPLDAVLEVFFTIHDPTSLNRQGHDVGTQYRSGIYTTGTAQHAAVRAWVDAVDRQRLWPQPVVTEVLPLQHYHRAEAYHQNYFAQHPHQGYCAAVVAPKVAKFQARFRALLK